MLVAKNQAEMDEADMEKTNALRQLDAAGIPYRTAEYAYDESDLSGLHAAQAVGMPPEQLFKTLAPGWTRAPSSGTRLPSAPGAGAVR